MKLVKARKQHKCHYCGEEIKKGSNYASSVGKWDAIRMHRECYEFNGSEFMQELSFWAFRGERPRIGPVAELYYIGELSDGFDFDGFLEDMITNKEEASKYHQYVCEEINWHRGALEKASQLLEKFK